MMSNYPLTCVCAYDVQFTLAMCAGLWIGEEIYREDIAVTCIATPKKPSRGKKFSFQHARAASQCKSASAPSKATFSTALTELFRLAATVNLYVIIMIKYFDSNLKCGLISSIVMRKCETHPWS